MISWAEADKLARMHAPEPTVLSLYLTVPRGSGRTARPACPY